MICYVWSNLDPEAAEVKSFVAVMNHLTVRLLPEPDPTEQLITELVQRSYAIDHMLEQHK
eukprot:5177223-Amphidinium_carterae.1